MLVALPLFVAGFVGLSLLAVIALRRWVPRSGDRLSEWDRVLRYVMAAYGVLTRPITAKSRAPARHH